MKHTKVLVTLIVCLGIIFSIFIVTKKKNPELASQKTVGLVDKSEKKQEVDTDGDGLKDWEEQLIGTDLKKVDTDGDGTDDNAEVVANRDPKKAGPGDSLTTGTVFSQNKPSNDDKTATEQVAQDFFGKYLLAKQQNIKVDQNTALQIAGSVIKNINTSTYTLYSAKDIRTSSDISSEAKAKYGQELSSAISKNSSRNNSNEIAIIANALETQKEVDLLKLDLIITAYKGIIRDTLKVTVPKDALFDHIVYLNAVSRIYTDITDMRSILSDPVKGYIAFSKYKENVVTLKVAFENMDLYFKKGY